MFTYPQDLFEKLEFDKILNLLAEQCIGEKAASIAKNIQLFHSPNRIQRSIDEISEFKACESNGDRLDILPYERIDDDIYLLEKEGYVLDIDQHLRVYSIVLQVGNIQKFFSNPQIVKTAPLLSAISEQIIFDQRLLNSYNRVFDKEGEIKPNASPELAAISKTIKGKEIDIDRTFNRALEQFKKSRFLADSLESYKGGRRVLTVLAEHKRKIKGIIHDESATGKTVFIEPQSVVELNNELSELRSERKQEIYRILRALSNEIRPYVKEFDLWQKIVVRYDLIRAKSKLSNLYDGNTAKVSNELKIDLKEIYHPLLTIINNDQNKVTVPFDLSLDKQKRILVISGPNAGGKSVTMKAVGLVQLMFQSGMHIPVNPESELGIFKSFMADIGDQQSLEEDLSTYSSRLINMKTFAQKAKQDTLVLIDEFGSGTDPQAGGAIAESILDQLVKKQSFAVITTHYSNIKMYAVNNKNIMNGAMAFDKENMSPEYRLNTGKPGSSFAFEIATKIGLPNHILTYAKKKAGKHSQKVDELLVRLQDERKELLSKLDAAEQEKKKVERLVKNYESMSIELDIKRKKLKLKEKEFELNSVTEKDKELQTLIRKIKEDKKLEDAQKLSNQLRSQKKDVKSDMLEMNASIYKRVSSGNPEDFNLKKGDYVKLNGGGESGEILEIKKGMAKIQMGIMSLEVPVKDLVPARENLVLNRQKSIRSDVRRQTVDIKTKIDLRGYSKDDAAYFLQEFLDKALLSNHNYFEILHGKGNGILRKLVLAKLKEYKDVKNVRHPEEQYGGNGKTLFDL